MVNSNKRKLALCGYLKENHPEIYESPLKVQKFLFFYECFAKIANETHDFSNLKGYKQGPVFSTVYGDYTKERKDFNKAISSAYHSKTENLNEKIQEQCAFLCGTMTEEEISKITHEMWIWKKQEKRIMNGETQVPLNESDFNESDTKLIKDLADMCPIDRIENTRIINIGAKYFVFNEIDAKRITETHLDTLTKLEETNRDDLYNPVYVSIDKKGVLIID